MTRLLVSEDNFEIMNLPKDRLHKLATSTLCLCSACAIDSKLEPWLESAGWNLRFPKDWRNDET